MSLLRRLADRRNPRSLSAWFRRRRSGHLRELLQRLPRPVRILDVGGGSAFWKELDLDGLAVVLLNLDPLETEEGFEFLEADARSLDFIPDHSFDVVVSNSVIEHVGTGEDQRAVAGEIRRIGRRYYVQTPNRRFPIDPHYIVPLFHLLPRALQIGLLTRFDIGWLTRAATAEEAGRVGRFDPPADGRRIARPVPGGDAVAGALSGPDQVPGGASWLGGEEINSTGSGIWRAVHIRASEPMAAAIRSITDLLTRLRVESVFVGTVARAAWLGTSVEGGSIDVLALMQPQQKNQVAMMASNRGYRVDREEIEQSEELDLVPLNFIGSEGEVRVHVLLASNALYGRMFAAAQPVAFEEATLKVVSAEDLALFLTMSDDLVAAGDRDRLLALATFDRAGFNQRLRSIGLASQVVAE